MRGAAAVAGRHAIAAADIAAAAQLACLLEASAPKPGNVSPARRFEDAGYEDFLASAAAIGAPLADAGAYPLGASIRRAVEATARWTRSNTNLGIVLLLAPLARAAFALARRDVAIGRDVVPPGPGSATWGRETPSPARAAARSATTACGPMCLPSA